MAHATTSGQAPWRFAYRPDLHTTPPSTAGHEVSLHGGFDSDLRPGFGQIYYGMPGCGIVRVAADLRRQELIPLPAALTPHTFHSTRLGCFDGKQRLFLPAPGAEMVAVVTLDGQVDFILPRPEFEAYQAANAPYKPTDTALVDHRLYIADGYGANYITVADVTTQRWVGIFGGKTADPTEDGRFATAHGMNPTPAADRLVIADRPHSRLQAHGFDGHCHASYPLPTGAWPCGIDFIRRDGRDYAVVGCLRDPVEGRPAPIYILDADTFAVLSTIRPQEELGVEPAQHVHNVIWHVHDGQLYLICQSWNPGYYFVLEHVPA